MSCCRGAPGATPKGVRCTHLLIPEAGGAFHASGLPARGTQRARTPHAPISEACMGTSPTEAHDAYPSRAPRRDCGCNDHACPGRVPLARTSAWLVMTALEKGPQVPRTLKPSGHAGFPRRREEPPERAPGLPDFSGLPPRRGCRRCVPRRESWAGSGRRTPWLWGDWASPHGRTTSTGWRASGALASEYPWRSVPQQRQGVRPSWRVCQSG